MRNYDLNDIVKTKKVHPCGGDLWKVVRFGADVKIKCTTCSRIVMLSLDDFDKRVKVIVSKGKGSGDDGTN